MSSGFVRVEHIIGYEIAANGAVFCLATHEIYATIDCNAIKPTVELSCSLEIPKPLIRLEKNVLCYIKSIFRI